MSGLPLALFAYAALAVIPTMSGGAQETSDVEVVAGRADAADRMTVPVQIGSNGPYHFLLDTGSQKTVLSTDLAARLALAPIEKKRIVGVAGFGTADTAVIDELGLGRRSFYGLTVLLFEARHIGADGIVGTESLQDQRVLMDFTRNSMAVGDAKSLGGNSGFEIVVTARRKAGQLIMTHADIDGVSTDVVIDTGSDTSIGNRALQRALGQRSNLGQAVLASVTGQDAVADLGYAKRLGVGDIRISNIVIAYTDGPAFEALDLDRRPALLLGMRELRLFKRVAIDFSTRKVMFDLPNEL
ncbi:aspartyl protease family protein [Novosphingobium sp. G106]|uniref:retroviral-like aspartic protease family protein n=1 Tax=Novosphingobium sp. G106 TaxID=2849500 RepID=UPI001C2D8BBD|nr:retroviral-like aspartic protease family protein [Novosphingobium sp. G106]MBV1691524.1 aspartyl protease family protein [Novosphingobium sp. G106]